MNEKKHCKWYNDEFCTNGDSPCVADYCPVVEYPELCKCREEGSEKEKPKSKKILANRVYSDATLKSWKKEDLIEQIRILEHNWAAAEEALNNSAKNSEKLFAEQKAEIEQLKEENIEQRDIHFRNLCGYKNRIAELEKQVDEQRHLVAIAADEFAKTKLKLEKSVKDTAKEILQRGKYCMPSGLREWIEERYGVEVE